MISRTRAALLAALSVVGLLLTPVGADAIPPQSRPHRVADDLDRLRAAAGTAVHVDHDPAGAVEMVRSATGRPLVAPPAGARGPREAAASYLDRFGGVMHLDGTASVATGLQAVPSAGGGHVVRATQQVGGLPVFAGDLVLSLDGSDRLLSLAGETTEAASVPIASAPEAQARRTALSVTAAAHRVPVRALAAEGAGQWLYDPALVGETDLTGVRPVWRFEVTGAGVRDLVLVDAGRGGVALRVDELTGLTRRVCDRNDQGTSTSVPQCTAALAVRGESTGETGVAEVDAAFTNIGRASDFYGSLGRDLGETIGTGTAGSRVLEGWARWCTYGEQCPMQNAYWDGARMVLGDGYAAADDVVAHELTHGVVDRTSKLVYLHQSGAINESLADVMGELVDQRNGEPGEDDSAWLLGEDVPGGAIRSMSDPGLFGQPDRMTSPMYGAGDVNTDNGEVHQNSGVGNKTAYLISQGGTFNGVTVQGIDVGDPSRTKTAVLYAQVMTRLTSGAEYDDLGRTLVATCQELAAAATGGFTDADCASVQGAVDATELMQQPADPSAAAAETSDACPTGQVRTSVFHDDDGVGNSWSKIGLGYDVNGTQSYLWTGSPERFGLPRYVNSGTWSWVGVEPDPYNYGDPSQIALWPTNGIQVPTEGETYLHFHHAYVLEWYPATDTAPASYRDGATVLMATPSDTGSWVYDPTPLTWVNGPDKPIGSTTPWLGFGGDSHGWGSSRVDLTPLAGKSVRPQWKISANSSTAFLGWYVDDIEIYNCRSAVPTAARSFVVTGTAKGAKLSWQAPDWAGSGVAGYRVTRSDGLVRDLPASALGTSFTTLPAGATTTFEVVPLNAAGEAGPSVGASVVRTKLSSSVSRRRVPKTYDVKLRAQLASTDLSGYVAGQAVAFQRRSASSTKWTTVLTRKTRSDGTVAARIVIPRTSYLRVVFPGGVGWVGSKGAQWKVTAY